MVERKMTHVSNTKKIMKASGNDFLAYYQRHSGNDD